MAINPMKMIQFKNAWDKFTRNHPKFPLFLNAVHQTKIEPGTIIEVSIKRPDGKEISTNIKVQESDLELLEQMKNMNM